ncbi:hypothetical protein GCM10023116_30700 [Kistimonas scapharcae]|uniref:Uncharacterized protein n=1 Tax=Kistimonas scapharcae TaxID=1036133 RepID=A0ABP8V4G8_9GAMM
MWEIIFNLRHDDVDSISFFNAQSSGSESDFCSLRSEEPFAFASVNRRQIPHQQRDFQPNRTLCSRMVVALCDYLMHVVYYCACIINCNAIDEARILRQNYDEIVGMSQYPDKGIRRSNPRGVICGTVGSASYFAALLMQRHGLARVTHIGTSELYVVRFSQWGGLWALGNFDDCRGHIHVYYQLMKTFNEVVTYAACESISRDTTTLEQQFRSLEHETADNNIDSIGALEFDSYQTLRRERAMLVGNMFMSSLQTFAREEDKKAIAQNEFDKALRDLEQLGTRGIDFFLIASARLNFWLSILYRLDGKTALEPDSIAIAIEQRWREQRNGQRFRVPEYIRQAVDPIMRLEADELNNMGRRLKASVPLIIVLLCERSGHPHTGREGAPDTQTALEIQNAIRQFSHLGLGPDLSAVPNNSHCEPTDCAGSVTALADADQSQVLSLC